jgi:glycerophosphoryl diester phosphodiesterase
MKPFEIVAHRGIPDTYPENTIPAFERAIELVVQTQLNSTFGLHLIMSL